MVSTTVRVVPELTLNLYTKCCRSQRLKPKNSQSWFDTRKSRGREVQLPYPSLRITYQTSVCVRFCGSGRRDTTKKRKKEPNEGGRDEKNEITRF